MTTRPLVLARSCSAALGIAFATLAAADGPPPQHDGQHGGPHGFPAEAVAACSGKTAGATASFTDREGRTVTGTCVMVLKPDGPPPGSKPPDGAPR